VVICIFASSQTCKSGHSVCERNLFGVSMAACSLSETVLRMADSSSLKAEVTYSPDSLLAKVDPQGLTKTQIRYLKMMVSHNCCKMDLQRMNNLNSFALL
jgi:hypothetical protein